MSLKNVVLVVCHVLENEVRRWGENRMALSSATCLSTDKCAWPTMRRLGHSASGVTEGYVWFISHANTPPPYTHTHTCVRQCISCHIKSVWVWQPEDMREWGGGVLKCPYCAITEKQPHSIPWWKNPYVTLQTSTKILLKINSIIASRQFFYVVFM